MSTYWLLGSSTLWLGCSRRDRNMIIKLHIVWISPVVKNWSLLVVASLAGSAQWCVWQQWGALSAFLPRARGPRLLPLEVMLAAIPSSAHISGVALCRQVLLRHNRQDKGRRTWTSNWIWISCPKGRMVLLIIRARYPLVAVRQRSVTGKWRVSQSQAGPDDDETPSALLALSASVYGTPQWNANWPGKTATSLLLLHWRHCSLALNNRYNLWSPFGVARLCAISYYNWLC